MTEFLAPGVFVEEIPAGPRPIEGVPTSTAGFIGPTRFGPVSGVPELVTSLAEYERIFEPVSPGQPLAWADAAEPNFMWQAARNFFEEGGKRLYVSRVFEARGGGDGGDDGGEHDGDDGIARVPPEAAPGLCLRLRHPGAGAGLQVALQAGANALRGPDAGHARAWLHGVREFDLLWLRRASADAHSTTRGAEPAALYLAHPMARGAPGAGDWRLEPQAEPRVADPRKWPRVSKLKPLPEGGDSLQVMTLTLSIEGGDGSPWPERWSGLAPDPRRAESMFDRLADDAPLAEGSRPAPLIVCRDASPLPDALSVLAALFGSEAPTATELAVGIEARLPMRGGNDGNRPGAAAYDGQVDELGGQPTGLRQFEVIDEIALVAAPGIGASGDAFADDIDAIAALLVAHAERMRYRIALLDSGPGQTIDQVRRLRERFDSAHAALYWPWVTVDDPVSGAPLNLPGSGFAAGICARVDRLRGVWKAPANEELLGVVGLEHLISAAEQDLLNPEGINAFRFFAGKGFRLWGARTLSRDAQWRYLSVRRFVNYLERSIGLGTQWVVFEPNGEALWATVRRTIEEFLLDEWQRGALPGERPAQGFFVRCDRTTMTQDDIDAGRLVCEIGVAPLRPAEFVVIRIGQWTADRRDP